MSVEPTPTDAADAEKRRAARNAAKLRALARARWGVGADADPAPGATAPAPAALGTGAAIASDERAVVLLDGDHGLGAALAWWRRSAADRLEVIVDGDPLDAFRGPGGIARQAACFDLPVGVWVSQGADLVAADPEPIPEGEGPPDAPELVAVLEDAGLDVVVEGDRLSGEYRGLEVVRIVRAVDDGEPILEVGVGRFDRELTAMMHGELPDAASVHRVVEQLTEIRRPGGPNHPLAGLVPERWLRSALLADPETIGCEALVAAPSAEPRDRLRTRGIATAVGTRDGGPVVVCATVGIDLDAVVAAADTRAARHRDATLLLAMPERDVLAVTEHLVGAMRQPAEIVPVPGEWRH